MTPDRVAVDLWRLVTALKTEAYNPESGQVDYAQLGASAAYAEYRQCARHLQSIDLEALGSREERLAFWINLYNALVVDAVIRLPVKTSVNDVPGFFWRAAYSVGGRRFCAFDIEYGILRANASPPAIPGPHFGARDPRRRYSLERLDPCVHFALVCAARSCPPIAVYDAAQIDQQLDTATRAFINQGGVEIDPASGELRLSQIFQWYAPDFGAHPFALGDRRPLLEFVARYVDDTAKREYLLRGSPAVRFQAYDWTLNNSTQLG